ncbi:sodium/pantothenate symporter [Plesiomonas sp.]|uniref:sodium/pantothenate symporter n=1 Tax=Plesiomonas sp. TaxID=2486279 RepID=UPI003F3D8556
MKSEIILPLVGYLVLVFAVALYAYFQRSKGNFLTEYYVGNRSMGGFLLAMTLTATYTSASSFIGGPGAAYKYGLGWVLLAMIQLPAAWLSLGVLGKKFAILSRKYNALTLNDLLYARYKNKTVVWISCASMLIAFFAAMTVQFIGGARLLQTAVGIPYLDGLLIFGVTVGLYTMFGGFRAVAMTDALQGIVMMIGTVILLFAVIHAAGGISHAVTTLRAIDPDLISAHGPDGMLDLPFMASFWVLVCFGVIGLPHTAVRCMAYKDSKALHFGMIVSTIIVGILMLGMHLTGALGRAVLPDLAIPDQVIPTLMIQVLPPIAAGIFLAAPMAAIMSTIDAQLIQSSATLIKDLYLRLRPQDEQNERRISRLSTLSTLILGVLLILAAWQPPEMIIWLNLLAFGGLQAVFLWPLVFGLYWDRANAGGALTSMIAGGSCYVVMNLIGAKPLGLHAIVPTLIFGLLAFVVGNMLTECHQRKQMRIQAES